ncbi:MaoC family dehydratase [Radicibacter daui]|uniref:MaoC family dehydratase n=1 Tax=Radicibacter daui TaxID=3064829 RepID=UPI004046AACD
MELLYLDDLEPGRTFTSAALELTAGAIKVFAAEYDPQPFHLDEEAATGTFFGGLAASGWHVSALAMKLLVASVPVAGGLIGAGGEIAWPRPTRPGDILTVVSEVLEVRASRSHPERGLVTLRSETRNQKGDTVQVTTMKLVVPRRP